MNFILFIDMLLFQKKENVWVSPLLKYKKGMAAIMDAFCFQFKMTKNISIYNATTFDNNWDILPKYAAPYRIQYALKYSNERTSSVLTVCWCCHSHMKMQSFSFCVSVEDIYAHPSRGGSRDISWENPCVCVVVYEPLLVFDILQTYEGL